VCGRVGYRVTASELVAAYPWLGTAPDVAPRYNIAPTDPVVVIDGARATVVTWGIDGGAGVRFNLRSETAGGSAARRSLPLASRVVIPVSHFYEWLRVGSRRAPVAISRTDGRPISLAGVAGQRGGRPAVTILTTRANRDLEGVHDRMPVVLSDGDARAWARDELTSEELARMLAPCPEGYLTVRPASPLVNGVKNDGPQLLDPEARPALEQLDLF
jgi:putative SOS response-associated peptidase YedK